MAGVIPTEFKPGQHVGPQVILECACEGKGVLLRRQAAKAGNGAQVVLGPLGASVEGQLLGRLKIDITRQRPWIA